MSFLKEALRRIGRDGEQVTPASLEAEFAQANRIGLAPYQEEKRGQRHQEETLPSYKLSSESVQVLYADTPKPRGDKLKGYLVITPKADGSTQQVVRVENYQQQDDVPSGRPLRFGLPPRTDLAEGEGRLYVERAGKPAWVFEGIKVPKTVPEKASL